MHSILWSRRLGETCVTHKYRVFVYTPQDLTQSINNVRFRLLRDLTRWLDRYLVAGRRK